MSVAFDLGAETAIERELRAENVRLRARVRELQLALDAALTPVTPRPRPLSKRQREVLDAIVCFRLRHGVSPTQRELAERFGCAPNAIACALDQLDRKGWIRMHRRRVRGIQVLHEGTP